MDFRGGNTAILYQEGLKRLEKKGLLIQGFCDNDLTKQGKELWDGKPVIAPSELKKRKNILILICTIRPKVIREIREELNALSLQYYLLDELILKFCCNEVLQCYDILKDEQSKKIYAELILCRLNGKNPQKDIISNCPYFELLNFRKANEEVVIDCGAYVGDTLEQYMGVKVGSLKKYIAFEPDRYNFTRLNETMKKISNQYHINPKRFVAFQYGLGERNELGTFVEYETDNRLGSKFVTAGDEKGNCNIVALDEFLTEPYTFLKADIESYEYKMLLGAKQGIKKYKPKIAVCIYHNAVDMFSILLLLQNLVPEYHFAVRHYLDGLSDTVLYAWIEG